MARHNFLTGNVLFRPVPACREIWRRGADERGVCQGVLEPSGSCMRMDQRGRRCGLDFDPSIGFAQEFVFADGRWGVVSVFKLPTKSSPAVTDFSTARRKYIICQDSLRWIASPKWRPTSNSGELPNVGGELRIDTSPKGIYLRYGFRH